ncbi:helix-turn-helix transcriptional regulator [Arthrobacter sp. Sa2BUA2]|uniref:Helix-turn-helix transcriptional regulator n=1 Tax=Arthrobacter pullicola TaxID=2762224 RepID=A0ABR8YJS6_9MICC|nr:XRE family transcriptional regulator [Arthrobacter pullicola]MBD8044478.1 helix-turn-helix transcriptional regulator [Arthrobacter pullicola]
MTDPELRQRISEAVRRERLHHGWSAAELARRAGVSKGNLSQLEAGAGNPTVETLWALSDALGIPFSTLVDPGPDGPVLVRAGSVQDVPAAGANYSASLLSACPPGARRDIYLVRAEPGEAHRSAPHQPGTVEHVVLVTGSADVGPEEAAVRLHPGDYLVYRGDAPHVFDAQSPGTSAVIVSELR